MIRQMQTVAVGNVGGGVTGVGRWIMHQIGQTARRGSDGARVGMAHTGIGQRVRCACAGAPGGQMTLVLTTRPGAD